MSAISRPISAIPLLEPRSVAVGSVAAFGLLGFYLGTITLAQGVGHALEQLSADALFVALITAGFAIQVALFVELRTLDRRHQASAGLTAVSTGTSTAAMLACCAHHVVDVLPIVGLSAAAVFLTEFRMPLFVLGIGLNLVGVAVIGRRVRKARQACGHVGAPATGAVAAG